MLSSHTILTLAAFACLIRSLHRCRANADLLQQLNTLGPLPRIAPDFRERVIASLPNEGEVQALTRGRPHGSSSRSRRC